MTRSPAEESPGRVGTIPQDDVRGRGVGTRRRRVRRLSAFPAANPFHLAATPCRVGMTGPVIRGRDAVAPLPLSATRHLGPPPATRSVGIHLCTFAQEHRSDLHLCTASLWSTGPLINRSTSVCPLSPCPRAPSRLRRAGRDDRLGHPRARGPHATTSFCLCFAACQPASRSPRGLWPRLLLPILNTPYLILSPSPLHFCTGAPLRFAPLHFSCHCFAAVHHTSGSPAVFSTLKTAYAPQSSSPLPPAAPA